MKPRDLLTRHVAVADPQEPLIDAARRMREEHAGTLVVVGVRHGVRVPVGMLTDRDIVVAVVAEAAPHLGTQRFREPARRPPRSRARAC